MASGGENFPFRWQRRRVKARPRENNLNPPSPPPRGALVRRLSYSEAAGRITARANGIACRSGLLPATERKRSCNERQPNVTSSSVVILNATFSENARLANIDPARELLLFFFPSYYRVLSEFLFAGIVENF